MGLTTGESIAEPTVSGVAHTTSTTFDPERGIPLTARDANGVVSTTQYDALGRPTSVWNDSRATTTLTNQTNTYTISNTGLSGVVTNKLNDNNGYLTSVTIEDALGRTRQTQTYPPQGGRLIDDTLYDSRGWVSKKNSGYWDSATTPVPYSPWTGNFVSTSVLNKQAKSAYEAEQQAQAQLKAARSGWLSAFEDFADKQPPSSPTSSSTAPLRQSPTVLPPRLAEIDEAMDGGIEGAEATTDAAAVRRVRGRRGCWWRSSR